MSTWQRGRPLCSSDPAAFRGIAIRANGTRLVLGARMRTTPPLHHVTSERVVAALAFASSLAMGGCAAQAALEPTRDPPSRSLVRASASPAARAAPANVEGVHAERIAARFGDPRRLAAALHDVLELGRSAGGDVRAVLVDEATGELIVLGTADGIAKVRALLAPGLTGAPEGDERVEVVPLANANAGAVAHTLGPMLPYRARLVSDPRANVLLVSGPAEERAKVVALAKALDVPEGRR